MLQFGLKHFIMIGLEKVDSTYNQHTQYTTVYVTNYTSSTVFSDSLLTIYITTDNTITKTTHISSSITSQSVLHSVG
jgi:hypothetical protein